MTKERGERGTRTHAEVGDDRREPIVLARKDARTTPFRLRKTGLLYHPHAATARQACRLARPPARRRHPIRAARRRHRLQA